MASKYKARITKKARSDLKEILKYSYRNHGEEMAFEYNKLINSSIELLEKDPFRPGSKERNEIASTMRSYHMRLAKEVVNSTIKSPRHMVFYFTADKNKLIISRVLHDARDHVRTMKEIRDEVMKKAKAPERQTPKKERQS